MINKLTLLDGDQRRLDTDDFCLQAQTSTDQASIGKDGQGVARSKYQEISNPTRGRVKRPKKHICSILNAGIQHIDAPIDLSAYIGGLHRVVALPDAYND